ncbi:MAG: IS66 family insertion sequence element accessory protein TnpB [Terriglobales bacterium]
MCVNATQVAAGAGRFVWPRAESGTVALTRAQLAMLLEAIDWRRPERAWTPRLAI